MLSYCAAIGQKALPHVCCGLWHPVFELIVQQHSGCAASLWGFVSCTVLHTQRTRVSISTKLGAMLSKLGLPVLSVSTALRRRTFFHQQDGHNERAREWREDSRASIWEDT